MKLHLLAFYFLCISFRLIATDVPLNTMKETLQLTKQDIYNRGKSEIAAFVSSGVWKGGYYEGDPQDPHGDSSYHKKMSYKGQQYNPLFICYSECIAPYVFDKDVLELGPGKGAWTKAIFSHHPKSITCVDALPAEYNEFWEYVGVNDAINYFQIQDFNLSEIPDESIDYVFSFGVFCHISPLLVQEYLKNLYPKLRKGALCFIMYADYDKKNLFAQKFDMNQFEAKSNDLYYFRNKPSPCWYHLGKERMNDALIEIGYKVISPDIEVNARDPIAFFIKE